jgi:hypothetical protein
MKIIIRVAALLLLMAAGPGQAITIDISPSSSQVMVGHQASVDIIISGLGGNTPPALGVYDIAIGFDPGILVLDQLTFGSGLDVQGQGSFQDVDASLAGLVNLFELSFDLVADLESLQPSAFTLASLAFDTLATGLSPLTLSVSSVGDALGESLSVISYGADIAVVPEPASWLLILVGVAGLALASRRRGLFVAGDANGSGLRPAF